MTKEAHNYDQPNRTADAAYFDYSLRLCTRCETYHAKTDFPRRGSGYNSNYCTPCAIAHVEALQEIAESKASKLPEPTCWCGSRSCNRHSTGDKS